MFRLLKFILIGHLLLSQSSDVVAEKVALDSLILTKDHSTQETFDQTQAVEKETVENYGFIREEDRSLQRDRFFGGPRGCRRIREQFWCDRASNCAWDEIRRRCLDLPQFRPCENIFFQPRCDRLKDCRWDDRRNRCYDLGLLSGSSSGGFDFDRDCEDIETEFVCNRANDCTWLGRLDTCVSTDDAGDLDCQDILEEGVCRLTDQCLWDDRRNRCFDVPDCKDIDRERFCSRVPGCYWSRRRERCYER